MDRPSAATGRGEPVRGRKTALGPLVHSVLDTDRELARAAILRALEQTGGNRAAAAEAVGVSRKAFGRWITMLGIAETVATTWPPHEAPRRIEETHGGGRKTELGPLVFSALEEDRERARKAILDAFARVNGDRSALPGLLGAGQVTINRWIRALGMADEVTRIWPPARGVPRGTTYAPELAAEQAERVRAVLRKMVAGSTQKAIGKSLLFSGQTISRVLLGGSVSLPLAQAVARHVGQTLEDLLDK